MIIKFQSTHPRGVRLAASLRSIPASGFNPRTHAGCDEVLPAWHVQRVCFNPRTHAGCDKATVSWFDSDGKFQSTHPRGVRLPTDRFVCVWQKFQSTHPRGVRPIVTGCADMIHGFQSTHPRGVRLYDFKMFENHRTKVYVLRESAKYVRIKVYL